jgi:phosphoribosylaminoimidazolecarboxamide formyltransferase / IMP cyclohydrolase
MKDYKKSYKEVLGDHFPTDIAITFGEQTLHYKKRTWRFNGKEIGLRYGDNPGQEAALYELSSGNVQLGGCRYVNADDALISNVREEGLVETGKQVGKSNLTDIDAALNILKYFDEPTAVVMKHNNPSGVASRESVRDAYLEANFADRIAAFGGVLAVNRKLDAATASEIVKNYLEVVIAPSYEEEALAILTQKKNMRLITIPKMNALQEYRAKRFIEFKALLDGGIIVQQSASNEIGMEDIVPAEAEKKGTVHRITKKPSSPEIEDMLFAWRVLQGVISNSMVFAKNKVTIAIGAGEQDRVGATELAIIKAYKKYADYLCFSKYGVPLWTLTDAAKIRGINEETEAVKGGLKGSVLASDGFLPFRDTVDVAAKVGVAAIIQPGGSTRDHESIEACNDYGITMVFTGKRVFRH